MTTGDHRPEGWTWFQAGENGSSDDELARAFAATFREPRACIVLDHLRRVFLDRRLGPHASDAELRHVEGQRTVVAHVLAMIERGR